MALIVLGYICEKGKDAVLGILLQSVLLSTEHLPCSVSDPANVSLKHFINKGCSAQSPLPPQSLNSENVWDTTVVETREIVLSSGEGHISITICIYTCIYIHTYIYTHVHIHIYAHIYTHVYVYTHICTYIYTYTHKHTHTYIYLHMNTHQQKQFLEQILKCCRV